MDVESLQRIKQFIVNVQFAEHSLDVLETQYAVDLNRGRPENKKDESYYPQIEHDLRAEAASMAPHYETFYSLERTIRRLIDDVIRDEDGDDWWNAAGRVPEVVKKGAEDRMEKERDTGMRRRSEDPLDFTNFGELGEIIKANWSIFGGMMSSQKAVEKVMSQLNSLRGPIAHCAPLREDEVLRLQLSVRDWFHLMQ